MSRSTDIDRGASRAIVLSEHALFRQGIADLLRGNGFTTIEATSPRDLRGKHATVVLIDLDHCSSDTATLVEQANHQLTDAHVVVIGSPLRIAAADGNVQAALETSAADRASILRVASKRAIAPSHEYTRLARQWAKVTPRQREVMRLLAVGHDNTTIAHELGVGARAIKAHVSALLDRFGVSQRTELALLASAAGLRPRASL